VWDFDAISRRRIGILIALDGLDHYIDLKAQN